MPKPPKPGKAMKRSGRALGRLAKNTVDRVEKAQQKLASTAGYRADDLATDVAGQSLDMLQVWLDLFVSVDDRMPQVFIEISLGSGSGTTAGSGEVELDETIANIGLLTVTDLVTAGDSIPSGNVVPTNVTPGGGAEVEVVQIDVTAQNSKTTSLYHGFMLVGTEQVAEIYVSLK